MKEKVLAPDFSMNCYNCYGQLTRRFCCCQIEYHQMEATVKEFVTKDTALPLNQR